MILFQAVSDIGSYLNKQGNPWEKVQSLNAFLPNIITMLLTVAIIAFTITLLYGGIQWITSGGDKEGLGNAQKRISTAIIGLAVLFSVWAIVSLVRNFFKIESSGGGSTAITTSSGIIPSFDECASKICWEIPCQTGRDGWCYKNCRCVCNANGKQWALENPWCDGPDSAKPQMVCFGGTRIPDPDGQRSGLKPSTPCK